MSHGRAERGEPAAPAAEAVARRRRGRPPAEVPLSSSLTVWLPVTAHDRLIRLAAREGISVSCMARALLLLDLDPRG